jgi:hypothetical protein
VKLSTINIAAISALNCNEASLDSILVQELVGFVAHLVGVRLAAR